MLYYCRLILNLILSAVVSKIAKPKAQSEDRELSSKNDAGAVRLQQIGIEPSPVSYIYFKPTYKL